MAFSNLFKRKPSAEQLQLEKAEAELAFLRLQLNPHLLYTTLDHIHAMAYPVSDEVAGAITNLSVVMRYMLTGNVSNLVYLQKEVEQLHHYIDLHRLLLRDHFFADLKISGDTAGIQIPQLMLFPFIENAFRYGITNDAKRPVRINLQASPNRLNFTVSYKIDHNKADATGGIDITNIRRRMEMFYTDKFDLIIANNGETYKSMLTIKLA